MWIAGTYRPRIHHSSQACGEIGEGSEITATDAGFRAFAGMNKWL
jgi:hypothetical protein